MFRSRGKRSGFTLIEIIIVVSISAFLSAYVITYSKSGERQISLFVEKQKIAGTIFRAKAFAIQAYNVVDETTGTKITNCGFGVEIDRNGGEYRIFYYPPPQNIDEEDTPDYCENISDIDQNLVEYFLDPINISDPVKLGTGLRFRRQPLPSDAIRRILFVSPFTNVEAIMTFGQGAGRADPSITHGKIYLETIDGNAGGEVVVSTAGQVDF